MKRFLLWSFERGSVQYDVICVIILAFIFLTPTSFFNDRPDFMRMPGQGQDVRVGRDDRGNTVFTVRVPAAVGTGTDAQQRLEAFLGKPVVVARTEAIHDSMGALVAYAVWIVR